MNNNYETMTKAQLIEALQAAKLAGKNRKPEVLALLRKGYDTIEAISAEMGITKKNVSSILSGLRKQGHVIINLKVGGQSVLQIMTQDQLDSLMNKG
jgi:biotin operon repressor